MRRAVNSSAAAPTPSAGRPWPPCWAKTWPAATDAKAGNRAAIPPTPAKAKHVIYLHMVGGPPQMDLYDYKPKMNDCYDKDLPDSIRMGQRLTTMTSGQARSPSPRRSSSCPVRQERHVGVGIAAEDGQGGHRALDQLMPLRDAFVAVFFVTVGVLIDPAGRGA